MRNYETARTIFAILEFVAWTAVVGGLVAAFAGASATTYYSSSSAGLLGAVPGIGLSLVGLIAAAVVQNSRAGVDSAEIAGKMLRIAEEQLQIAKDQKKASYAAAPTFAQPPKSSSAPTPPTAEARTAPAKPQAAVAPSRHPAPSLVMKKKEPEVFGRAPTLETIEHDGTSIRRTDDAFFIGELRFAELEPAKAFIDANLSKASKST